MIFSMIFTYTAELFPTKIRGFTSGFLVFLARCSYILAPTIIELADYYQIHPLIIATFPCIPGVIAAMLLPETLNSKLIN